MMILDTLITLGIIAGAAVYLYRKFAKSKNSSGCSTGGGCCGTGEHSVGTHHCCSSKQ